MVFFLTGLLAIISVSARAEIGDEKENEYNISKRAACAYNNMLRALLHTARPQRDSAARVLILDILRYTTLKQIQVDYLK